MSGDLHDLDGVLRAYGGAPEHLPGFEAALAEGLDDADREMGRAVRRGGWLHPHERPVAPRRRLALVAAVAVAAVAAILLVGLPAGQRVMERFFGGPSDRGPVFPGPEPAQAEVLAFAQQALRTTHTITAGTRFERGDYGSEIRYSSVRSPVVMAADRSMRQIDHGPDGGLDMAYDASTGVEHVWGWSADPAGRSVDFFLEEYVGTPPGEPEGSWLPVGDSLNDFWYAGLNPLYGAVARAVTVDPDAKAQSGMFDGRPVWIVTCPVVPNSPYEGSGGERMTEDPLGYGSPGADYRLTISVDQETGLPLRVQSWAEDELVAEVRLTDVKVDEPLPDGLFSPGLPTAADVRLGDDGRLHLRVVLDGATKDFVLPFDPEAVAPDDVRISLPDAPGISQDDGFRRLPVDQVASATGRAALVPGWLPDGFRLALVAVKKKQGVHDHGDAPGRPLAGTGIVMMRYDAGFQAVTITTRELDPRVTSESYSLATDPFIGDKWPGWPDARTDIRVSGGAFAGARGAVVVAPLTIPHLWAVKDGMLLTISGDCTADELIAIAESMSPLGTEAGSPLPSPDTTGE